MGKYKEEHGKTRIGAFLSKSAPKLLDAVSDVLPDKGLLGVIKSLVSEDETLSPADKELAIKYIEQDLAEMEEVTKRWQADMTSDSWLSKNVRPLALIFLTLFTTFIMFSDSKENWAFDVKESYIDLMEVLLVVVYAAYFGSRGAEKINKIRNKK